MHAYRCWVAVTSFVVDVVALSLNASAIVTRTRCWLLCGAELEAPTSQPHTCSLSRARHRCVFDCHGNTSYVGSYDGFVYAIDARTGLQKWSFFTGDWVLCVVAHHIPCRMVPHPNATFKCYVQMLLSVCVLFSIPLRSAVHLAVGRGRYAPTAATAVTTRTRALFLNSCMAVLYCASPNRGTTHRSSPVLSNGVVFIGSKNDTVYALHARDGTKKWSFMTKGDVDATPVISNGIVFVGSYDGALYALDAQTGVLAWRHDTRGEISATAMLANVQGKQTVYIGSFVSRRCANHAGWNVLFFLGGGYWFLVLYLPTATACLPIPTCASPCPLLRRALNSYVRLFLLILPPRSCVPVSLGPSLLCITLIPCVGHHLLVLTGSQRVRA